VVQDIESHENNQMPRVGDPPVQNQANEHIEPVDHQVVYDRGANPPPHRDFRRRLPGSASQESLQP
jgi:hypothetical protein